MQTKNKADENFRILAELFPNAVTEVITGYDENGQAVLGRAVDAEVLRQEISCSVVEGKDERYQFTWPDKKKAVLASNLPVSGTLRPCRGESVNFDDTGNLYIEGDNLDVLKLLQETYLGKVSLVYIDPPYNTGHDFIYSDDFVEERASYVGRSGQTDAQGNRLVQNTESSGRFHTNWLNSVYPRIKLSKPLLSEDGVIIISIDENECCNMKKMCDEIFGEKNYFGDVVWEATTQPINAGKAKFGLQKKTETLLVYGKNRQVRKEKGFVLEELGNNLSYPHQGKFGPCRFEVIEKSDAGSYNRETMKFKILGHYPREGKRWQIGKETAKKLEEQGRLEIVGGIIKKAVYPEDEQGKVQYKPFWSLLSAESVGTAQTGKDELNSLLGAAVGFDTVKPTGLLERLISYFEDDAVILDFYSGSATTAQAVISKNGKDGGKRKFILVQAADTERGYEDSDAYKAGYANICEIGKERIRRAGEKIREECPEAEGLDIGFRVLKLDSSNMKDVYYCPDEMRQMDLDMYEDNIKEGRTPEDLLFQVMLDLGVVLSSKMKKTEIAGKEVFEVADGILIACFDQDVSEETVKEIAKKQPSYAVFRDSSMANDSMACNFEQIFEFYSPKTVRKVL